MHDHDIEVLLSRPQPMPVVQPGEFPIAVIAMDHPHIYGMVHALTQAGAVLRWVYDPDTEKASALAAQYAGCRVARCEAEILDDPLVRMVVSAAVTSMRCDLGIRVMEAGKDYFTDKAPMTTLAQLEAARMAVTRTGRMYMVYYSERLHSEAGMFAGELITMGAIGRVLQVMGWGPHRLSPASRAPWFFEKEKYGGILCDIGSHQFEQFLTYTGASDAEVTSSQIANYAHPEYPELEDFGDAMLRGNNGTTGYFRVDWFTPAGLSTWGDGRTVILGTDGYMELRKYTDVGGAPGGDHMILVDGDGEKKFSVAGRVGYPFFGRLIMDCLNRTESAMTQAHAFKAAEICLRAQAAAQRLQ